MEVAPAVSEGGYTTVTVTAMPVLLAAASAAATCLCSSRLAACAASCCLPSGATWSMYTVARACAPAGLLASGWSPRGGAVCSETTATNVASSKVDTASFGRCTRN